MQLIVEQPKVRVEGEKVVVEVPWDHADGFHAYLRRQGIEAVLCLNPAEKEAHLELPAWADPEAIGRDLEHFERSPRPRSGRPWPI